jgi:hypothetical protein
MDIIKIDENDEPVRDPKTGLVVKAGVLERGELVGKIVEGIPNREFKGYMDCLQNRSTSPDLRCRASSLLVQTMYLEFL